MAVWVQDNLGLKKDYSLDRINNNGHYEPGNLRWATQTQQVCNARLKRKPIRAMMHSFKLKHPEVAYADSTLLNLLSRGFSTEQIIRRFNQKSVKPKGVYGIYSTADPDIASQLKDCLSPTV
jgi:hypothetical protein